MSTNHSESVENLEKLYKKHQKEIKVNFNKHKSIRKKLATNYEYQNDRINRRFKSLNRNK